MIVRLSSSGSSFKGLAAYLTHDPKSESDERVAWTHTLNLAHDDVSSAVDEMLWTTRDAELLKQEAGIRAGGRQTENPVKHISLNWSPDDKPSREHMVATAEDYLRHMKWDEHQAVLIAHEDKTYAHVHIMLNTVHPETGLSLNDDFERRRSQKWALNYERENGHVYCEERLKDARDREDSPPRNIWMAFRDSQQEFEQAEKVRALQAENSLSAERDAGSSQDGEWKKLKEIQRREREEFFADGKAQFSELRSLVYGDVREEFRDMWGQYFRDREAGLDAVALGEIKARIVTEQNEMLTAWRDEACVELRTSRDELYRGLLDEQRQTRAELRGRQEEGWDNTRFFEALEMRNTPSERITEFREAAQSITAYEPTIERSDIDLFAAEPIAEGVGDVELGVSASVDLIEGAGFSMGLGLMNWFDMALREFEGSAPAKPRRADGQTNERLIAEAATGQRELHEREIADDDWRRRNQEAIARE